GGRIPVAVPHKGGFGRKIAVGIRDRYGTRQAENIRTTQAVAPGAVVASVGGEGLAEYRPRRRRPPVCLVCFRYPCIGIVEGVHAKGIAIWGDCRRFRDS